MRLWEKNIRQVVPYVPGEQPAGDKIVKLNTNENPYPPAPGVKKVLEELDTDRLRKYPDPAATVLVKELAAYYGLGEDQVFVGVGSDDVLAMSFLTFFNSDKPVLFPDVTYSFYKVWADLFKVPFETPALKEDFTIDTKDYAKERIFIYSVDPGWVSNQFPKKWNGICDESFKAPLTFEDAASRICNPVFKYKKALKLDNIGVLFKDYKKEEW